MPQRLSIGATVFLVLTVLVAAIGRSMGTPVRSAPQLALLFLIWAIASEKTASHPC